jgi:polyisoprenoid-binding protein YceI
MTTVDPGVREWNGLTIPTPGKFRLDPVHSQVAFVARHLMVTKVRGVFRDVSADIEVAENPLDSTVDVTIQAASVDTGEPNRDNHLRTGDFLLIEQYPTITFTSKRVSDVDGDTFKLVGDLTIRGVTKEVVLDVEFGGVGQSPYGYQAIGFSARTEIDREDFGASWNAALEGGGVVVGRKVKIEIEGEAARQ